MNITDIKNKYKNIEYINYLPLKNGVSASKKTITIINDDADSIFSFCCKKFNKVNPSIWKKRFENKQVFIKIGNLFVIAQKNMPIKNFINCDLYYYKQVENEIIINDKYEIIYENDSIIVVDKPHFLPTTPSGAYIEQTLLSRLKHQYKNKDITPVHRLDRQTAGVVLFCKNKYHRGAYQNLFATQQVKKCYHAIAKIKTNLPKSINIHIERSDKFYTMQVNLNKAPNSHTKIKMLYINAQNNLAKYALYPSTGKMHQLRVHLNYIGIPIYNDSYYPTICQENDKNMQKPLQLLAKSLAFIDPIDGAYRMFVSRRQLMF